MLSRLKRTQPEREGHSKKLWRIDASTYAVELKPTLRSYTFAREAVLRGTEVIRLDFFERSCHLFQQAGLSHAFISRLDERTYASRVCKEPPIEVILKNAAVGSTQTLYPGLFPTGTRFSAPVVKFDFRRDPQDLPLPDDYLRELGLPAADFRKVAITVNDVLRRALPDYLIVDFCLVFGLDDQGQWRITSEVSPDSMRLTNLSGDSFDKDLFRTGATDLIQTRWRTVADALPGWK